MGVHALRTVLTIFLKTTSWKVSLVERTHGTTSWWKMHGCSGVG